MSKSDLLARVNAAVEAYLVDMDQVFRGQTKDVLTEEDVISFTLQTVKQRLTQRRKGQEDRRELKRMRAEHPELFVRRHRTGI